MATSFPVIDTASGEIEIPLGILTSNTITANNIISSYNPPLIMTGPPPSYFDPGKKTLTAEETRELARQLTRIFPEDETLLLVVDSDWSSYQIEALQLNLHIANRKMVIIREPRKMALIEDRYAGTETERIDFLARIGVIWENNPGLTLTEIIKTMTGAHECGDEIIVAALELAWG